VKTIRLPSGEKMPAFGLGTWRMGDDSASRVEEIATVRLALERGPALIDTAEMYGNGRAEQLVGEAIAGRRDKVFLVSKALPQNATRRGAVAACQRSLRRLGTDRLDLYLLHWRGNVPLAETLEAFLSLQQAGKIRHFGVSNLDLGDMQELWPLTGGSAVATNQVYYNLTHRGIEWDLLPWLRKRRIPTMAYSPIDEGRLPGNAKLVGFAKRHGMTAAQAALAWLLSKDDVVVIPKTGSRARLEENLGALDRKLTPSQLAELDRLFPPPKGLTPLEMV
jgi:diketogulonate reductase-like aldo/keto reductase